MSCSWSETDERFSPTILYTPPAVAEELDISKLAATDVIKSQFGGETFCDRKVISVRRSTLDRLRSCMEPADISVPALSTKVRSRHWDVAESRHRGWHAEMTEEEVRTSVNHWHQVKDAEQLIGVAFVVSISSFVVHVAKIEAVSYGPRKLRSFTLGDPDPEQAVAYENRYLRPQAGSLISKFGV